MTISLNDFEHWLSNSKPGSSIIYHDGFLAQDVLNIEGAADLRRSAWHAYEEGLVALTQRRVWRHDGSSMEYIAQRRGV